MVSLNGTMLLVVLAAFAVLPAKGFRQADYDRRYDVMPGVEFYWRIRGTGTERKAYFALTAPITVSGWVGLGVGEPNSGSMPGADVAVAMISAPGNVIIDDYFTTDFVQPTRDCARPSDWTLVTSETNVSTTVVEFWRFLRGSSAVEDRPIEDNGQPTKLIFAYGVGTAFAYHGVNRHATSFNLFTVSSRIAAMKARPDTLSVRWGMTNYQIPSRATTYAYSPCYNAPATSGGAVPAIIGFDTDAQQANAKYIHHIIVKGYPNAKCNGFPVDLWGIASLHVPLVFDDDIGVDMTHASYNIEIHYANPSQVSGVVDSSGVTVYYTYLKRAKSAGLLQLGDPKVLTLWDLTPGITGARFTCPSACTKQWASDITVFGDLLHMHQVGAMMHTRFKFPNGSQLTRSVEYYSFATQQNSEFAPFVVPRGTAMDTTCWYKIAPGGDKVQFGLASTEEMCIHFLYYYPVQSGITGSECGRGFCGTGAGPFHSDDQNALDRGYNGTCSPWVAYALDPGALDSPAEVAVGAASAPLSVVVFMLMAALLLVA
jgi:dopamine beta-monooxygenase